MQVDANIDISLGMEWYQKGDLVSAQHNESAVSTEISLEDCCTISVLKGLQLMLKKLKNAIVMLSGPLYEDQLRSCDLNRWEKSWGKRRKGSPQNAKIKRKKTKIRIQDSKRIGNLYRDTREMKRVLKFQLSNSVISTPSKVKGIKKKCLSYTEVLKEYD